MNKAHFVVSLFFVMLFVSISHAAEDSTSLFLSAKQKIEKNCYDCRGGSKAGLSDGIKEAESALKLGYPEVVEVLILLRDGYITRYTAYDRFGTQEKKDDLKEIQKLNKKLLSLMPEDLGILEVYVNYEKNVEHKTKYLKKIIDKNPNNIDAHHSLSWILINNGNVEEGVKELKETIRISKGERRDRIIQDSLLDLKAKGLTKERDEIEKEFKIYENTRNY